MVTGNTPDISEWLEHSFYDVVWYINSDDSFPTTKGEKLAPWCGVSHRVGQAICYWILTVAGTLISCTTVRPVTDKELRKPDVREQIHNFKLKLNESLRITSENTPDISEWLEHSFYDVVWYINSDDSFPTTKGEKLTRWCGVSHRVGQAMCYWILTVAGTLISCTTV